MHPSGSCSRYIAPEHVVLQGIGRCNRLSYPLQKPSVAVYAERVWPGCLGVEALRYILKQTTHRARPTSHRTHKIASHGGKLPLSTIPRQYAPVHKDCIYLSILHAARRAHTYTHTRHSPALPATTPPQLPSRHPWSSDAILNSHHPFPSTDSRLHPNYLRLFRNEATLFDFLELSPLRGR